MNEVAVLIPVYNNFNGLEASLKSIKSVTKITIVVVDDGSHEKLELSAIASFTKHDVKLISLASNKGIVTALNEGLRYIYEKNFLFVARLDAGDLMTGDRLRLQVDFLTQNPDCMIVGGGARFVDAHGGVVFQYSPPESCEVIKKQMHVNNCFCHPAVMWKINEKRRFLYDQKYQYAEDYHLFWGMVNEFGGANLAINVVDTLADPDGISRAKRKRQLILRLKIQLEKFDLFSVFSYKGVLKSLVLFLLPVGFIDSLKKIKGITR